MASERTGTGVSCRSAASAAGPARSRRGRATARTPPAAAGNRWLLLALVIDLSIGSVLLDRLDPVQRGRLALVHFAGRDDLTVGGHQVEVVLAVGRLLEHELARHVASSMRASA